MRYQNCNKKNRPDKGIHRGRRPLTAAIYKNGKIDRNSIVSSHNENRITTGFGTFLKDKDGVFRWCVHPDFTCVLNGTESLRKK